MLSRDLDGSFLAEGYFLCVNGRRCEVAADIGGLQKNEHRGLQRRIPDCGRDCEVDG